MAVKHIQSAQQSRKKRYRKYTMLPFKKPSYRLKLAMKKCQLEANLDSRIHAITTLNKYFPRFR